MAASEIADSQPPVRVLCVTPVGLDGMGGIDRLYYYLRQSMGQSGHSRLDIRYFAARGSGGALRWVLAFPFRAMAFAVLLLRFQPDVVHINHSTHGSVFRKWVLARIAHMFNIPVTTHFHGLVSADDYTRNPVWLGWFRALCTQSVRIVILGQFFADDFSRRFGIDPGKLIVIPNGIPDFASDLAIPKPVQPEPMLLFAGEVGPRKGAGLLLEALALLRKKVPDWNCTIAGNGNIAEYKAMATMLGLKDKVRFTGWVGSEELHDLMRKADIVVLPSRLEALPLSLIEGACAGTALVASNAGASAEVAVNGRNGIIIPLHSEAIAEALAELLSHPARMQAMQGESRKLYLERFGIGQFEKSLTALFVAVATKQPTAASRSRS